MADFAAVFVDGVFAESSSGAQTAARPACVVDGVFSLETLTVPLLFAISPARLVELCAPLEVVEIPVGTFVTASGALVVGGAGTSIRFTPRRTKMDSFLRNTPKLYSREHRGVLRSVMQAVLREDDRIGGEQDELEA